VASSRGERVPDPLGKRALFWVPPPSGPGSGDKAGAREALPVGKRALYSGARPEHHGPTDTGHNPLAERGAFTVECERCRQTSHAGVVDMLIFQFPIGLWLPRGRYDRRMTCPSCRRRTWCSVTLRRG
jgi:hypothetical protein